MRVRVDLFGNFRKLLNNLTLTLINLQVLLAE